MPTGRAGSAHNPILLGDSTPPQAPPTRSAKTKQKQKVVSKAARDAQGRFVASESAAKQKTDRSKVVKATPPPKKEKKPRPSMTECAICATTKSTKRSFKASDVEDTCDHFQSICDQCVQKLIKTKIAERQLADAHLPCMFPDCESVLGHSTLKKVMSKALFAS